MEQLKGFIPKVMSDGLHLLIYTDKNKHDLLVTGYLSVTDGLLLLTSGGDMVVTNNKIESSFLKVEHDYSLDIYFKDIKEYMDNTTPLSTWKINTVTNGKEYIHVDVTFNYIMFNISNIVGEAICDIEDDIFDGFVDGKDFNIFKNPSSYTLRHGDNFYPTKLDIDKLNLRMSLKDVEVEGNLLLNFDYSYHDDFKLAIDKGKNIVYCDGLKLTQHDKYLEVKSDTSTIHLQTKINIPDLKTVDKGIAAVYDTTCDNKTVAVHEVNGKLIQMSSTDIFVEDVEEELNTSYKTKTGIITLTDTVTIDGVIMPVGYVKHYAYDLIVYNGNEHYLFKYGVLEEIELKDILLDKVNRYCTLPLSKEVLTKLKEYVNIKGK